MIVRYVEIQEIIDLIKSYDGCSLTNRTDELATLVARGVDDPSQVVKIHTNCGMFALGIMKATGVQHDLLNKKYVSGQAIAWIRKIGSDLKVLNTYHSNNVPVIGSLLHYYTSGKNDNHVEWLLSNIDEQGHAFHGGGGRTNNEITMSQSADNVLKNAGRPLQEWIDVTKLICAANDYI